MAFSREPRDRRRDMAYQEITWEYDGRACTLGLERAGSGPAVLLLPALSSISTRREMAPLQARLAAGFTTIAADWPGFGDHPKPNVDWRPPIYQAYLGHLLAHVIPHPFAVIAAGHAAGYVIRHFANHQHDAERLVLLSPTWRGPLPTLLGARRTMLRVLGKGFDPPLLGAMLYTVNVNRLVVGMMARGHVYANGAWLDRERMADKLRIVHARGARRGSARFVSGCLDPFDSRGEQLACAARIAIPVLNLFPTTAPRKSRAEMEALSSVPTITTARLTVGKLSFYEEFPDESAEVIGAFLATRQPAHSRA